MEILFSEDEEASSIGLLHHLIISSSNDANAATTSKKNSNKQLNYERICCNFRDDEMQYMRDLSLIVNVFKRRLESFLGQDAYGRVGGVFLAFKKVVDALIINVMNLK